MFETFLAFLLAHPVLSGSWAVLIVAFMVNESLRGGSTISPQQAVDLINKDGAVVIDLRERKEFAAGHIVGAINIPSASLNDRMKELEAHKAKPVILACSMGQHAGVAGASLRRAGFSRVVRISGGMGEWRNSNLPLVKAKG